tara:strand:- start:110 stop:748 length:639 start_codon:yes stop_codon:yes gene_type:complete
MAKRLIIIRHGESIWNYSRKYTGWVDVPLTNKGIKESKIVGEKLIKNKIIPTISYTSELIRSIDSNKIILDRMNLEIETIQSWRLNERHYGLLSGYDRTNLKWQGKYFDLPPIINKIENLNMYKIDDYNPIYGESYYMTYIRLKPIWNNYIIRDILNNRVPIICAHKNSLKVLVQLIENLSLKEVPDIQIENSIPIIYEFDDNMNVMKKTII